MNEHYLKWIKWGLSHDRNFKISNDSGFLELNYSNLLIYVYDDGKVSFLDKNTYDTLFQSLSLEPENVFFVKTLVTVDNRHHFDYNTNNRKDHHSIGITKKFEKIF